MRGKLQAAPRIYRFIKLQPWLFYCCFATQATAVHRVRSDTSGNLIYFSIAAG
ncbi:MAG: hypothetical protein JWR61_756 [Ferruginibacter sp.]|nr:hypothetical protein [Ferruginibacter sp.]